MNDITPITPFVFSPSSNSWIAQDEKEKQKEIEKDGNTFRLATLNVLHNNNSSLREHFLQSPKRNNNMVKLISELDAGIYYFYS